MIYEVTWTIPGTRELVSVTTPSAATREGLMRTARLAGAAPRAWLKHKGETRPVLKETEEPAAAGT